MAFDTVRLQCKISFSAPPEVTSMIWCLGLKIWQSKPELATPDRVKIRFFEFLSSPLRNAVTQTLVPHRETVLSLFFTGITIYRTMPAQRTPNCPQLLPWERFIREASFWRVSRNSVGITETVPPIAVEWATRFRNGKWVVTKGVWSLNGLLESPTDPQSLSLLFDTRISQCYFCISRSDL